MSGCDFFGLRAWILRHGQILLDPKLTKNAVLRSEIDSSATTALKPGGDIPVSIMGIQAPSSSTCHTTLSCPHHTMSTHIHRCRHVLRTITHEQGDSLCHCRGPNPPSCVTSSSAAFTHFTPLRIPRVFFSHLFPLPLFRERY